MSELTLYVDANYDSPWALTAFIALEEKGLPYRLESKVLSKKETFAADYGAHTKKIPALRRGDFWLAESMAIAEYLAESFPSPRYPRLFPENLEERAVCREIMLWLRTDFMPLRQERPTTTLWFERTSTPLSPAAQEMADRLLTTVQKLIVAGRNSLATEWSIADIDLSLMLQRLNLNGAVLPAHVKAYAEANWDRPAMRKWHQLPRGKTPL